MFSESFVNKITRLIDNRKNSIIEFLQMMGIKLKGDVIIECVVDEEGGGNGTLASIIRGYRADAGVITEPWGIKNLAIGHRGSLGFRITVEGQVAPVDKKAHGVSAIEKMQIILEALQELKVVRQETVTHPLYAEYENSVPIIVGTIQGGSWLTSVPLRCVIEGFLGWLPNELLDNIQKNFREYIYKVSRSDPWLKENPPKVEFPSLCIEPCQLDSNHPIIKTIKDSAKSISRQDIKLIFVNAGADQWLLNLYGGTPTVQFGPGGGNAHSPDEFIYISELTNCTKILIFAIIEWCGVK
ncbi:M20/M25/M40 family metallo-hydrolase [Patescibacteria group bacterium]|nr:M20/M25/M40 family metallo-hydrolase [Patescibacteria group bacterium]